MTLQARKNKIVKWSRDTRKRKQKSVSEEREARKGRTLTDKGKQIRG